MDMDRKALYRLWLLFVVVATGLVWTWGQVGQRSAERIKVGGEALELLRTEEGCDLAMGPCAAYGGGLALVAAAKAEGEGVRWQVKLVGTGVPSRPRLQLSLLTAVGKAETLPVMQTADTWQAHSGRVTPGTTLRVRVEGGAQPLVADFPLRGAR